MIVKKNTTRKEEQNKEFKLKSANPIWFDATNGDHVIVTRDRMKVVEYLMNSHSDYKNYFLFSLGIFIPTLISLPTVDKYSDFFGVSGSVWNAFGIILVIIFGLTTLYYGFKISKIKRFSLIDEVFKKQ